MKGHTYLFWIALAVTLTLMFFLFGCNILVRKVPWNYIVLVIFTVFESYLVASVCIWQQPEYILIAAVMTLGMFFGLTLLAFFVLLLIDYVDNIRCDSVLWSNKFSLTRPFIYVHHDLDLSREIRDVFGLWGCDRDHFNIHCV